MIASPLKHSRDDRSVKNVCASNLSWIFSMLHEVYFWSQHNHLLIIKNTDIVDKMEQNFLQSDLNTENGEP